ncbi:MAG: biotin/lipoyl-binding protein, partial [Peristeroidobacter soli]
MPLDTESLGSLRIERSSPTSGGNRTGLYVGLAVGILVVAAGVWFYMRPKPTEVTTVTAEADSSGPSLGTSVLNASGYVVARRMATVSSKITGKVLEIYVEEGMEVKKDQVLARLDPENGTTMLTMAERELEAAKRNLTEIEVRLADARRNLERNEALV